MPISLSVVIPSRSRPDLLRACLSSVRAHAPPGVEVVVVDDGSADRLVSRTAAEVTGVRILRRSRPGGFCAAVNAGLAVAAGEFVEVLNDDTLVTPGWAAAALAAFDDPTVGAVAPLVLMGTPADAPRIDSAGDTYWLGGVARKRGHGQRLTDEFRRPCDVFGASGSSAFYRRELVQRVGGFPAEFGAYFEDVDLSFRIHRAGYRVRYQPASVVYHRVSASYGRRPPRRVLQRQSLNEERVFWRNVPGPLLWRAVPLHTAVLLAKATRRVGEGAFWPFFWGRMSVLADLPRLCRHRRWLNSLGTGAVRAD